MVGSVFSGNIGVFNERPKSELENENNYFEQEVLRM